jgi:hypothetical protein
MSNIFGTFLLIGFFLLVGIVLALPLLLFRRIMKRSQQGRILAILSFSLASFTLLFGATGIFLAQAPVIFACTVYDLDACYPYAREAGLENSDAFERLATEELIYRNLIPSLSQQPCYTHETSVCAILDREEWANEPGAFWYNFLAGVFSGVGTAVTLLFFTRKRGNVGQSPR